MEIYEALKNDHDEIKEFLEELLDLDEEDEYRYVLIEQIKNLVIPHSRAEESILYNTLRAINQDSKMVFHGYEEHIEAEALIRDLQLMDKLDYSWKEPAAKLENLFLKHVENEELEVFKEARMLLSSEEAESMCLAFEKLKPTIRQEGVVKSTIDNVVSMMPPRLVDSIRKSNQPSF